MKSFRVCCRAVVLLSKISSRRIAVVPAILAVLGMGLLATPSAQAQAYVSTLLHSFTGSPSDGQTPYSGLIEDASGNLYGTTYGTGVYIVGGPNNFGNVYELVKSSSGTYTEKVLHSFDNGDGAYPLGGLIMDAAGNLYGTTQGGGQANNGVGTVFELVNSSGVYTEKILHNFINDGVDGYFPYAGVIMDASGNLYGTTSAGGGTNGVGTVFELVNSSGVYTEKILHTFTFTGNSTASDGYSPYAGVIMDASGNLYGTTLDGGANYSGAVYELVNSSGAYTETILLSFGAGGAAGSHPYAGVIMDASGNLYGTAYPIVYELANSSGTYTEKVLFNLSGNASGVIMDASGNLYGTTPSTAFELVNSSGTYSEKILHAFSGSCTVDGVYPYAGLLMDASGDLFGTTLHGGSANLGTVFEILPFTGTSSPSSISITSSINPATAGNPVQFMLSVTSTSPFPPETGTVALLNGATVLGSAPLSCGAATLSIDDADTIGVGTFTLTAQYTPDTVVFAPTSTTISQTINEAGVVLSNGNNSLKGNQTVNGTVTTAGAGSGFFGNGSGLTNLNPASLSTGTAGINITGNAATATVAATAVTSTSATTAANATALGGVAAANYARMDIANSFNGNQTVTGGVTVSAAIKGASLAIGGGTPVTEYVSITQSVTLPALPSAYCATFTTPALTGFTPGVSDTITVGVPKILLTGLETGIFLVYQAWENSATASPTITIQVCNPSGSRYKGGASGLVRVDITKH